MLKVTLFSTGTLPLGMFYVKVDKFFLLDSFSTQVVKQFKVIKTLVCYTKNDVLYVLFKSSFISK